jgi:hypothetical protein
MKNIITKVFVGVFCASTLFTTTGCIDETFPTNRVTEEQVSSSAKATEALLWAIPAFVNKFNSYVETHYDWGYGSIMHIRDVMTGDFAVVSHDYDQYNRWQINQYMGNTYIFGQFIWNYYWPFIQTQNNLIKAVNPETASDVQIGMLGAAQAFRAMTYLDMAQMFEFLPNDKTSGINASGNDVTNLTVPIVRETTTVQEARNNPRATRDEMAAFILEDLNNAEANIVKLDIATKTLPHLDVVYGLKARYYMWLGDYANAKTYARLAIDNSSVQPMNEKACTDPITGFNQLNAWMWGSQMVKEDDVVQTGILNWTSWASNETAYGYASAGPFNMIDASMYSRISNTDFRKKMYKAPAGHELSGKETYIDASFGAKLPTYASLKFRPNAGEMGESSVGSASAFPLMRVEEMYFIEAEAAEHLAAGAGIALLEDFMKSYRDPQYKYEAPTGELQNDNAAIDEIVFQKRVELWGEGQTFFDIKRLNMSVTRGYKGTNFKATARFNTNGRPAWMNFCIVVTEERNNEGLKGYENPDPSDLYTPWTE